jgi:hypothetical protein
MKLAQILSYCAIALAALAGGMGVASSYAGAEAALLGLGIVLVFRALLSKASLRRWSLGEGEPPPRSGPISTLVSGISEARDGSYLFQARIASILRSIVEEGSVKKELPKELLVPESAHRLKGGEYIAALETAVEVLRNG